MSFATIKRRILPHHQAVRFVLVAMILLVVVLIFAPFFSALFRLGREILVGPVNVFSVIFPVTPQVKNDNGRVNLLILGTGGAAHDGPDLTDTLIVVSLRLPPEQKTATISPTISLISIPRDVYLDSLSGKINTAYSLGLAKDPSTGLTLAKAVASQVVGLPIHYAVRVDFSAFEKIIDVVGGIDVTVENSFTDDNYPLDGKEADPCDGDPQFKCRYRTVSFSAGRQHLDGATALVYVRSRHAQGDEGTDFARAKRQQEVLRALKEKIFSTDTFLNPDKVLAIYTEIKSHLDTDISPTEAGFFLKKALSFRQAPLKSIVLDETLLVNPLIDDRGWVLVPQDGTWDQVHNYIKSQLEEN